VFKAALKGELAAVSAAALELESAAKFEAALV